MQLLARLPVSRDQIQLVQATWQQVLPIRAAAADLFYGRLFELAPDTRPLFQRDIHAQGAMLMATLDAVVRSLENLAALLPTARQLAQRHVGYGVQPRHYDSVGTALLWTLEQGLGAAMTPAARAAWQQAYAMLAGAMKEAAYPAGAAGEANSQGPTRQSAHPGIGTAVKTGSQPTAVPALAPTASRVPWDPWDPWDHAA